MTRWVWSLAAIFLVVMLGACGDDTRTTETVMVRPTPTLVPPPPTSTPPPPTSTPTPTPTATAIPTATPVAVHLFGTPTATPPPTPSPTPQPTSQPKAPGERPPAAEPTATPSVEATPTSSASLASAAIPPIPTAVPTAAPTAAPRPTATAAPIPTATPRPQPTSTPVPNGPQVIEVGCTISNRNISVGQTTTLQATQSLTGPDIRYRFNHGDGTLDPNAVSQAYYAQPGSYPITLEWFFQGTIGTVSCGTVTVSAAPAGAVPNPQIVSLSEFLGLGRDQAVAQAANRGFAIIRLTREDSTRYAITNDYRQDRLNLELDNGRVSRASVG